ncbi:MAG: thioredoxin SoxW [uncultured Thiotrichaceae bacterium]|uniref:Thioredoxin SoxW n=1 Tax=uncultured Thiotrichaceae bacterium TaxID=298394 RepID=A0A6S6UAG7_9GAMM|nr:MAG: thioredoxin SoxW [uncultured Thiotrichaceae bacterium]
MNNLIKTSFTLVMACLFFVPHAFAKEPETERGKVLGSVMPEHPSWFKESFLEIADDAAEAGEANKHAILFMEMNGCPYCSKMIEENFKAEPYKAFIQENFDVIALNVKGEREVAFNDETTAMEKEIADLLKVKYTPAVIFLNKENKQVARVNGYRNAEEFKLVLDYVKEQAYEKQGLSAYLDSKKRTDSYTFRSHPDLEDMTDLSSITKKPLAVLFEDKSCVACDALHDGYLKDPEVRKSLEKMAFVRLDGLSDSKIIDPEGVETTSKAFAEKLGVTYRPSIVLFDQGKEIVRIESKLYRFHFSGVLEYVADGHYKEYPNSPFDYINAKTEEVLQSGKDVNIAE